MAKFAIARRDPKNIIETFRAGVDREAAQGVVDAMSKWVGPIGKTAVQHFLVEVA